MTDRKPGERPADLQPPANLTPSPPVPAPSAPDPQGEHGGRNGPDPVRYGDWEKGGIAIDF